MAYSGLPTPPQGFTDLKTAWDYPLTKMGEKHICHIIGVCVDFLPPAQSRGSHLTMKMTLHDPYWIEGIGMEFRLFMNAGEEPKITNQGDVIIFRDFSTYLHERLGKLAWSSHSSNWTVIECDSLRNSTAADFSDVVIHRSARTGGKAPMPDSEQIRYAKAILEAENSSGWQPPPKATSLAINSIITANGGTPISSRKDRLIGDLTIPSGRDYYIDLIAEVRRIYTTDMRMELSVTDYTENSILFDHSPESETGGYDAGDQFGYVVSTHKAWPGPWGRRTLTVTLWEPHRSYSLKHVMHGSLVQFRNVHIKLAQSANLEGVVHTDNLYPDKVLLSSLKPYDAETNEPLRDLLKRKKAYEDHCKQTGLRFIRDADPNKIKGTTNKQQVDGGRSSPQRLEEAARDNKARRNKKKKEKQKAKALAAKNNRAPDGKSDAIPSNNNNDEDPEPPSQPPNAHVRTNASSQSLIPITTILDDKTRLQTTAKGNTWTAPFVNRRYKTKVKVIDFYPDNLEDFARRVRRKSEYAAAGLSDAEEDSDDQVNDGTDSDSSDNDDSNDNDDDAMSLDGSQSSQTRRRRHKWEWRFCLIITDPSTPPSVANEHSAKKTIDLLVTGPQAEYLLRDSACNLRKNPAALNALRQKMFVLWGDLEERLTEDWNVVSQAVEKLGEEERERAWQTVREKAQREYSSVPFECFIEEYGVLKGKKGMLRTGEDGGMVVGRGERVEDWQRCFRIQGTTVA